MPECTIMLNEPRVRGQKKFLFLQYCCTASYILQQTLDSCHLLCKRQDTEIRRFMPYGGQRGSGDLLSRLLTPFKPHTAGDIAKKRFNRKVYTRSRYTLNTDQADFLLAILMTDVSALSMRKL